MDLILSSDGASWIKTQVNVHDHVIVVDVDLDEIGKDGDIFVEDYVSHLTMLPLDKARPLWDIHILNIKTSDAEAVCVIRSHHSLGDGTSLISLLVECTKKTSHHHTFSAIPMLKRRKMAYGGKLPWLLRPVLVVLSSARLIWNTFVDLLLVLATALFLKDTKTPLKGGVGVESNPKRFCHRIVSLDDIKLIKEAMNMSINDVLMGVTQAALSRCLNNFPGRIRLTACGFVNLRPDTGIQPLADMLAKNSKWRWGNYISLFIFPTSTGIEIDPLMYLTKAKTTMDRKKHSLLPALQYSVTKFFYSGFGAKVGATFLLDKFLKRLASNTTISISNMIGPMEDISFHGHPITYIAPSVYGHAHALTIHFLSYAEKMIISIGVDPKHIPNPHAFCESMEDSLKAMKVAILERGLL